MKRVPLVSPLGLLQESLWPSEWFSIVSCVLLNRTTRKQVEKVLPEFMRRWQTAESLCTADEREVASVIKSLGFSSKRSAALVKLAKAYVKRDWSHARELPGVGQYAARSWEIFCKGELGDEPPVDHALREYYDWAKDKQR